MKIDFFSYFWLEHKPQKKPIMIQKLLITIFFALFTIILNAQMVLVFDTNLSDSTVITLPLYGDVNVEVDWGDNSIDTYNYEGNKNHNYTQDGIYAVTISGTLTHYGGLWMEFGNASLILCTSFGDLGLTSLKGAFFGASNLIEVPTILPPNITDLSNTFSGASLFNQDIGSWDVSSVKDMSRMFNGAASFNQDISNWGVSSVTNMRDMFSSAIVFNQDIGNWDVSSVRDMYGMFNNARSFNQDIGNWNVSSVTDMSFMFGNDTSFSQDIGNWDVSSVTNMRYMFYSSNSFNEYLGNWDVSSVTDMGSMFYFASLFNQDISNWNVSSVTDMGGMFESLNISTAY